MKEEIKNFKLYQLIKAFDILIKKMLSYYLKYRKKNRE